MSGIGSTFRKHWVEIAWGGFALMNLMTMFLIGRWVTIPFHFIWVSLTLVYGVRLWPLRETVVVLIIVCATTSTAIFWAVTHSSNGPVPDELAEVPLMGAMFLAMVWHARRRQAALDEVHRLAEAEHRLLESQREFVRDASHELRTPITVARGHTELIRDWSSDLQRTRDADVVLDELDRLAHLSERLLILAAAEHPEFLSRSRLSVEPFILWMGRRWTPTASRRWSVDAAADGFILADEERLAIAVDSLVENAVKFTSAGDAISIGAYADDGELVIEVNDSGLGIPPDQLERIFAPFKRADGARTGDHGGSGLGLAIVRAIVDAHGGSVEAEGAPGHGATFRIRLHGFDASSLAMTGRSVSAPAPAMPTEEALFGHPDESQPAINSP